MTQARSSKAGGADYTYGLWTPQALKESEYQCNGPMGFAEATSLERKQATPVSFTIPKSDQFSGIPIILMILRAFECSTFPGRRW